MNNIYTAIHNTKNITIKRYTVNAGQDNAFNVTSLWVTTTMYNGAEQEIELRLFENKDLTLTLDPTSLPLPKFTKPEPTEE